MSWRTSNYFLRRKKSPSFNVGGFTKGNLGTPLESWVSNGRPNSAYIVSGTQTFPRVQIRNSVQTKGLGDSGLCDASYSWFILQSEISMQKAFSCFAFPYVTGSRKIIFLFSECPFVTVSEIEGRKKIPAHMQASMVEGKINWESSKRNYPMTSLNPHIPMRSPRSLWTTSLVSSLENSDLLPMQELLVDCNNLNLPPVSLKAD